LLESLPYGEIGGVGSFFLPYNDQAPREYFASVADELLSWRKTHQPKGINFGSVFKNGDDFCAGELIDKAGLKDSSAGDAIISNEHAKFYNQSGK
jgi:UDP-N-acetylenolpyruvoylglucosamine reductase